MQALMSFDQYGDFELRLFFASKYNQHPSKVSVYLDVEETSENYNTAKEKIRINELNLEKLFCKWTKSKSKRDYKEDYEYFAIYYSKVDPIVFELELNNDELSLECYYDCSRADLEKWCLEQTEMLREEFGGEKTAEFNVLTLDDSKFKTTKVKINRVNIDLKSHYNTDFIEINTRITKAYENDESGLILLYGTPGTGKTTYIKHLVQSQSASKFIFIPNDFVKDLLKPSFIAFMVRQVNVTLIIEDAEKIISNRDSQVRTSVVSTLLQLTDGLFSDYLKIKVICTFNTDVSKVDPALFRKGRMIASYQFGLLTSDKVAALSKEFDIDKIEPMTLGDAINYKDRMFEQKSNQKIGFRK